MFRHQRTQPNRLVHGAGFGSCNIKDKMFCTPAEADGPNNRLALSPNFIRDMFCGAPEQREETEEAPRLRISVMAVAESALSYEIATGGTEMRWEVTLMLG